MDGSFLASIFFGLAWLYLIAGIYFYKKSQKKLLGVSWIIVSFLLSLCWHALVAALITFVHIPVNIVSMAVADVLAGSLLWYFILLKKKGFQGYEFHIMDTIAVLVMLGFALWFIRARLGGFALHINYATIDPSARFIEAMDVVNYPWVKAMFFQALTNGLLIEFLSPVATMPFFSRIFVFSDALFLFFAGWMFYGAVRRYLKTPIMMGVGILGTVFYLSTYPLNSTLYGFVYLGMSITLIAMLVFLMDSFVRDEEGKWFLAVMLMLGCFGLIVCYSFYVPVVYVALILAIFAKQKKEKKLVSLDTVLVCLVVFLIPVVLGFIYSFLGVFVAGEVSVEAAIASVGGNYQNLYSDFLPWLPLAIYGYYKTISKKEGGTQAFLLPVLVVFILGLFAGGMVGRISSYYYFKTYNLLWFVLIFLLIAGLSYMKKELWILAGSHIAVWLVLLGVLLFNVEERIEARNPSMIPAKKSGAFFEDFAHNRMLLSMPPYPQSKQNLYHYAYNELLQNGEDAVAIVSSMVDAFWYHGITNQRYDAFGIDDIWSIRWEWYPWYANNMSPMEVFEQFREDFQPNYAVVIRDGVQNMYQENAEYFDAMEKVYENEAGFIVRLP